MRRTTHAVALLTVGAAFASGCGDLGARQDHFVVRDSAGIEIVENHGPRWRAGEEWRLPAEPLVSIGVLEGAEAYQLFGVAGAVRLGDGTIVIANGGTSELRFYDAAGRFIRSMGRRGSGPGEFESLSWLTLAPGDSLAAYDFRSTRLTIVDRQGALVRTVSVSSPAIQGYPSVIGITGGRVLFTLRNPSRSQPPPGVSRDSIALKSFDPKSGEVHPLFELPGSQSWLIESGGMRLWISPPFGRGPQFGTLTDGFYFGSNDTYEVGYYDPDGVPIRVIRRAVANRPVEAEHVAAVQERTRNPANPGGMPPAYSEMMQQAMSEAVFPATFPAFRGLRADDEGNLWVREYTPETTDPQEWTIFDPNGRMLGTIGLASGTTIHHIGPDFILVGERDDLEIEYVRLYELIKP